MSLAVANMAFGTSPAASNQIAVTVPSTTAGNLLVILAYQGYSGNAAKPTSASDGTNTFTAFGTADDSTNNLHIAGFYLPTATAGKTTMTVTFDLTGGFAKALYYWEVSGFNTVATDSTPGSTVNGVGSGTTVTGPSVTTTASVGFLAAMSLPVTGGFTDNPKSGNAFTSGAPDGNPSPDQIGDVSLISSAANTYAPAWTDTNSGDHFTALTIAFKETAGPSFVPHQPYMMPFLAQ